MEKRKKFKPRKKMKEEGHEFDYLLTHKTFIAECLTIAWEEPNSEAFMLALATFAKAQGMGEIAKKAGLGRESLYKALSKGAHPRFETISAVMHALGVKFAVMPMM